MKRLPSLQELGFKKLFEDRILVKLESFEQKTKSGLILPVSEGEEKQRIGIVIGFGPGEMDDAREKIIRPVEVEIGDRVMFGKYEGSEINIQGDSYFIIRQIGVIALMGPKLEDAIAPAASY
jgi:chaperonin GroES